MLVVGDAHGAVHWLRKRVIPYAVEKGCTRIVQLGDFGFVWDNDHVAVERELSRLHHILTRAGVTLHFLPGRNENHVMLAKLADTAHRTAAEGHYVLKPSIFYTGRVSAWSWRGVRFAAVGCAAGANKEHHPSDCTWGNVLRPEEILAAQQVGPTDVLFTHDAPAEMPTEGLGRHVLSVSNREPMSEVGRAMQAKVWMHGQYHRLLKYKFLHPGGFSVVMGLSCDNKPLDAATAVFDLDQFQAAMGRPV